MQAARHGAGDAECLPRRNDIQAMEFQERGERCKERERAGSVKPALVMLVGDAQADLAAYFHAQRVSLDQRAAAHAPPVEVCQYGGVIMISNTPNCFRQSSSPILTRTSNRYFPGLNSCNETKFIFSIFDQDNSIHPFVYPFIFQA